MPNKRPELVRANLGVSPLAAALPLAARVEIERRRLFQAIAILECCRNATATLFKVSDPEYMSPAFEAIRDLLNASAAGLERIATECENPAVSKLRLKTPRLAVHAGICDWILSRCSRLIATSGFPGRPFASSGPSCRSLPVRKPQYSNNDSNWLRARSIHREKEPLL